MFDLMKIIMADRFVRKNNKNLCLTTPGSLRAEANPFIVNLLDGFTEKKPFRKAVCPQNTEITKLKPEKIFAFDFFYDYKSKSTDMCKYSNKLLVSTHDSIVLVPSNDYKGVHNVYDSVTGRITTVKLLEENLIAFGMKDSVCVFDLEAQKLLRTLKLKNMGSACSTVIETTSKTHNILIGSTNGVLNSVDLSCKTGLVSQDKLFDFAVMDIKYRDGYIACCGLQEAIKVFDIRNGVNLIRNYVEPEYVSSIAWVSNSSIAYPKAYDNRIEIFDIFSLAKKQLVSRGSSVAIAVLDDCREFLNFPSWNGIGYFELFTYVGSEWKCKTFSFEDSIAVYGHVYNNRSKLVVFDFAKEMFVFDSAAILDIKPKSK